MARHRRTHFPSDPYPCSVKGCLQRFPNRKTMLEHEKVHKAEISIQMNSDQENYPYHLKMEHIE